MKMPAARTILLLLCSIVILQLNCGPFAYGGDRLYGYSDSYEYDSNNDESGSYDSDSSSPRSRGVITANDLTFDSIYNRSNISSGPYAIDSLSNEYNIDGGSSPYEIDGWANELAIDSGIEVFE